jgi:hypothetical protein
MRDSRQTKWLWLTLIIAFAALVVLLWLPFGVKTTGIMEEWMIIHDYHVPNPAERTWDVGWLITSDGLRMRPFTLWTFMAAQTAFPDSFIGYNLIVMALYFARGILLYAILMKLFPRQRVFAVLTTFLFILFPADDGLFTFRAMNVHTAVVTWLLAVYMLLSYWQNPRWWKMGIAWAGLVVCLFTYELGYPLVLLTPFLIPWWEGRFSKRLIRVSLLWWIAPVFTFIYAAYQFTQPGESYQSWAVLHSGINSPSLITETAMMIGRAYSRHFYEGWQIGISQINPTSLLTWLGTGIGVLAVAVGWRLTPRENEAHLETTLTTRRLIGLFLIGLIIIFMGVILFILTPYRTITWHTYYFSGLGGALSISSLVYLLTRRWQWAYIGVMGLIIAIAGVRALNQHQYYVDLSRNEQGLLRGVAGAAPRLNAPADTTLIVVDETGNFYDNWTLGTTYLVENALRVVYEDYTLNAILCRFDPESGAFLILGELRERCSFGADGITLYRDDEIVETVPFNRAAVIRFTNEGTALLETLPDDYLTDADVQAINGYDPLALIDVNAPPPRRYNTMFDVE